jgi:hypothetical protein
VTVGVKINYGIPPLKYLKILLGHWCHALTLKEED